MINTWNTVSKNCTHIHVQVHHIHKKGDTLCQQLIICMYLLVPESIPSSNKCKIITPIQDQYCIDC